MTKEIKYGTEAITNILKGAEEITRAVKSTLGPKGKNVVIEQEYGLPIVTKDGVTVAKAIELQDAVENIGAQMIREASSKTVEKAGDGTTTVSVLAYRMMKHMTATSNTQGINQFEIKSGMDKARDLIISHLTKISEKISGNYEAIKNVASISANGDPETGEIIADAIKQIGEDGVITVETGKGLSTDIEIVKGMQFEKSYLSPYFVTNKEKMMCELDNPIIFLYDKKISSIQPILPILEQVAQSGKSLLIIAEDVDGEALATLAINKMRSALRVCAVKAPSFGDRRKEIMEDIAILTGGTYISEDLGMKLENVDIGMLGTAKQVVISKDRTTIIDGSGDESSIQERISSIRNQISKSDSDYETEKLKERLAKLSGGVAVIKVGGATEIEVKEKKDRIDDALHATRAAIEEGIVAGGGVTLLKTVPILKKLVENETNTNIKKGIEIITDAITWPFRTIIDNAGESSEVIMHAVLENNNQNYGYDAKNNEFCDMIKSGIIDPTKVVRTGVENAISVAATINGIEAVIFSKKTEEGSKSANSGMNMMGGY